MSIGSRHLGGNLVFFDRSTQESLLPIAPIVYQEDFRGAYTVIPTSAESGMDWLKKTVETAGTPTAAGDADAAGGSITLALDATSEKQEATVYWGDQRQFDLTKGLVFECRAKLAVLPTLAAELVFGLLGDWTDGADAATYSAFFTADGSGEVFCEMDDNATDRSATSGVTALNTEWHVYRIEAIDVANVAYYIDGTRVATGTTFGYAATGANAILQPYLSVYKASGAGVGSLTIDYVKLWQNR